jgi:hypothetical protein
LNRTLEDEWYHVAAEAGRALLPGRRGFGRPTRARLGAPHMWLGGARAGARLSVRLAAA